MWLVALSSAISVLWCGWVVLWRNPHGPKEKVGRAHICGDVL